MIYYIKNSKICSKSFFRFSKIDKKNVQNRKVKIFYGFLVFLFFSLTIKKIKVRYMKTTLKICDDIFLLFIKINT